MYGSPTPAATKDLNHPFSRRKEESELRRQQQMSSGMLRYRSAPSSLLGEVCENFLPVRPSSPETDIQMFTRFLSQDPRERNPQFKQSPETEQSGEFAVAAPQQILYHSQPQQETADGTNLIRHSSSPAGFFSHLNVDNSYGLMRGLTGKGQISFSSRQNSLSQISEMGNDGVSEDEQSNGRCFMQNYPVSSWEDSLISESFSGFKRTNQIDLQDGDVKNQQVTGFSQPFGLPKSSSEVAAIEKFLQFQDSVPCKIRAKRGCATHPRSIAERMRRTRISERMRKLQELVPNMDKQTNTADMLDLAVEYIKDLQKQAKTLTDGKAACTCSTSKQKSYQNLTS